MSTFNSLSYATQLVATGLPREQAGNGLDFYYGMMGAQVGAC